MLVGVLVQYAATGTQGTQASMLYTSPHSPVKTATQTQRRLDSDLRSKTRMYWSRSDILMKAEDWQ